MDCLYMDLRGIKPHLLKTSQKRAFNNVLKQHNCNNTVLSTQELAYILQGGKTSNAAQKQKIKKSLKWLPKRHQLSKAHKGFYHLKNFMENDPTITVTTDGLNQGYSYKEILEDLTEKYLNENYTTIVDAIELKTKLVQGSIYKVEYVVYMHDIKENENVLDYEIYSKEFKDIKSAVGFVNQMKKTQAKKETKNVPYKKIVSVNYDTNAVKIHKRKAKVFGVAVPFISEIESIGRGIQKRFGAKVIRVTWLAQKARSE